MKIEKLFRKIEKFFKKDKKEQLKNIDKKKKLEQKLEDKIENRLEKIKKCKNKKDKDKLKADMPTFLRG